MSASSSKSYKARWDSSPLRLVKEKLPYFQEQGGRDHIFLWSSETLSTGRKIEEKVDEKVQFTTFLVIWFIAGGWCKPLMAHFIVQIHQLYIADVSSFKMFML